SEDKRRIDLIAILNQAINKLDLRRPHSKEFYCSLEEANAYIEENIYDKELWQEDITAHCIGHTHIDVAWRWTVEQSRHKAARSFATALNYMNDYKEFKFLQSQPQLYKFVKEDHPEIYEQVRERVADGRWEADGGMWVEADCNLISGESMVRQFLFGTRYFKQEFGVDNKLLWLPDVFGYSATMPQILKKCGIDYFVTSKLSWSEYNNVPYDTFQWKGIDGTEVLTHFIMNKGHDEEGFGTHYGGMLSPSQMAGGWKRYQQKDLNNEILHPYGYGDGGGGPTKEMLETARRMSKGIPGIPKVKMGKARDYLEKLEQDVAGHPRLPKWSGELYLEYHRGTYTSMAKNKKYNRQSEFLYQDVEWLSALNTITNKTFNYPKQQLNTGWELILLNQFHDIIPGCSIPEVYVTSHREYEEVMSSGQELLTQAKKGIASSINLKEKSIVVYNSLSFKRTDLVCVDYPEGFTNVEIIDLDGSLVQTQRTHDGKLLMLAREIPAKGYKAFTLRERTLVEDIQTNMTVPPSTLCNTYFYITINEQGNLSSVYDKLAKREVLKGEANVLQAFEDKPLWFDAWDINMYYQEKMWDVNDVVAIEVVESGDLRSALKVTKTFMDSTIEQIIYVYNHKPVIDFKTNVDWHEHQILLKAAFPVDVLADKATYEIQYGNVERATHENTSWDKAKFEVCAHKWADLSEGDYGVSLLNDCKYGYDVKENTMRLSLIKSGIHPNPNADQGAHEFTYSLYPHRGEWKAAKTVNHAYELNCPLSATIEEAHVGTLPTQLSMVSVDVDHVMVDVVKQAEDSNELIIRLYDFQKRRGSVTLTVCAQIFQISECDLLENNLSDVAFNGNQFTFNIKPFEIKTFKVKLK
ncbi:MAG: alpha-mannosidase, partial [Turicibacter sp.]